MRFDDWYSEYERGADEFGGDESAFDRIFTDFYSSMYHSDFDDDLNRLDESMGSFEYEDINTGGFDGVSSEYYFGGGQYESMHEPHYEGVNFILKDDCGEYDNINWDRFDDPLSHDYGGFSGDWSDMGQGYTGEGVFDDLGDIPTYHSMRKQWGGEPRYASFDKQTFRQDMYNTERRGRYSNMKDVPNFDKFDDPSDRMESFRRSMSHLWSSPNEDFVKMEAYDETDLGSTDGIIFEQLEGFADHILHESMTDEQYAAFKEYTSTSNFQDMLTSLFGKEGIAAFYHLKDEVKQFISDEWFKYSSSALEGRLEQQGLVLDEGQVDALSDADMSYLDNAISVTQLNI